MQTNTADALHIQSKKNYGSILINSFRPQPTAHGIFFDQNKKVLASNLKLNEGTRYKTSFKHFYVLNDDNIL